MMLFIILFQVIKNDIFVVLLTGLHHLEDGCKAPVQSGEVLLREEGGHLR